MSNFSWANTLKNQFWSTISIYVLDTDEAWKYKEKSRLEKNYRCFEIDLKQNLIWMYSIVVFYTIWKEIQLTYTLKYKGMSYLSGRVINLEPLKLKKMTS